MVTIMSLCQVQLWLMVIITAVSSAHYPKWQTMLRRNNNWKGHYGSYGINYSCTMHVHSVQLGTYGNAWVTFDDGEAVIDMTVSSSNETLVFKLETMHKQSSRFPGSIDIVINGKAAFIGGHWVIMGKFVEPKHRGFSKFYLVNVKVESKATTKKPSSMTLGLAVGIPVTLFVIITILAVLLFVWAVRKGYLRHVPSSFERFRNPPSSSLSDHSLQNGVNISLENQNGAAVHM